jgi:two-component system sensor histidine kinase SenX3
MPASVIWVILIVVATLSGVATVVSVTVAARERRRVVARLLTIASSAPAGTGSGATAESSGDDGLDVGRRDVDHGLHLVQQAIERARAAATDDRESRSRLQRALRAIPEGVVVVDDAGEIVFRNDVAEEFALARHGDALVEAAIRELVAQAVSDGQAGTRTLELFGPPRRTMVISARPLITDNRAVGALAIVEDITERRRLEAIRRDFVANISHELKTPVGALSLLAEALVDEEDHQVSRRLAERMVTEAMRLANTIEDLLVLSRIESEEAPEREAVPIHLVVAQAVNRIRPAAEQAGIAIDAPEPEPNLAVMGDRRQLVSALYNLLDNAVKYSDAGSSIDVNVTTDGRLIDLVVADHGIGIPSRDLERVFERFYRVDLARSRQTGGTGLGLAIVRHVVANHEGEVAVESRLGEGSTFTLRLPLTATGPVAIHDAAASSTPDEQRDAG